MAPAFAKKARSSPERMLHRAGSVPGGGSAGTDWPACAVLALAGVFTTVAGVVGTPPFDGCAGVRGLSRMPGCCAGRRRMLELLIMLMLIDVYSLLKRSCRG